MFNKPWAILTDSRESSKNARRQYLPGSQQYTEAMKVQEDGFIAPRLATDAPVIVTQALLNLGVKVINAIASKAELYYIRIGDMILFSVWNGFGVKSH